MLREHVFELWIHVILVVLYAVGAALLSGIGLLIEYSSLSYLLLGDVLMAGWTAVIGGVFLLFGALVVKEKLIPVVTELIAIYNA